MESDMLYEWKPELQLHLHQLNDFMSKPVQTMYTCICMYSMLACPIVKAHIARNWKTNCSIVIVETLQITHTKKKNITKKHLSWATGQTNLTGIYKTFLPGACSKDNNNKMRLQIDNLTVELRELKNKNKTNHREPSNKQKFYSLLIFNKFNENIL